VLQFAPRKEAANTRFPSLPLAASDVSTPTWPGSLLAVGLLVPRLHVCMSMHAYACLCMSMHQWNNTRPDLVDGPAYHGDGQLWPCLLWTTPAPVADDEDDDLIALIGVGNWSDQLLLPA